MTLWFDMAVHKDCEHIYNKVWTRVTLQEKALCKECFFLLTGDSVGRKMAEMLL